MTGGACSFVRKWACSAVRYAVINANQKRSQSGGFSPVVPTATDTNMPYKIFSIPTRSLSTRAAVPTKHISVEDASKLSENVIGISSVHAPHYDLPLQDRAVSIRVASVTKELPQLMKKGLRVIGSEHIETSSGKPWMDVQVLLVRNGEEGLSALELSSWVETHREEIIKEGNTILKSRNGHGKVEAVKIKCLDENRAVLEVTMDTQDSMGAAMVNRLGTEMKQFIESKMGWLSRIPILSNDTPERWASARVSVSNASLLQNGINPDEIGVTPESLKRLNHAVMLGIHGAIQPLFNDTRGVNEAMFSRKGTGPLLTVERGEHHTVFKIERLPMPLGTKGRPRMHPATDDALQKWGDPDPMVAAKYVVSTGLIAGLGSLIHEKIISVAKPRDLRTETPHVTSIAKGMSWEQLRLASGFSISQDSFSGETFEGALSVVPNVLVSITHSNGESLTLSTDLYAATEEKTVAIALAVGASVFRKCGGISAQIFDEGDTYSVQLSALLLPENLAFKDKNGRTWTGQDVIGGIKTVVDWEKADPRRACTGGKGEQNGGAAVAQALGADWVKIMMDFSMDRMATGAYKPCMTVEETADGKLRMSGKYSISKEALHANEDKPEVTEVRRLLAHPNDEQLAAYIATGFFLSRIMAVRMLGTFGVDVGHRQQGT